MEAFVSGNPRDAKKVSVSGADRLWECKNTEFEWELRKRGLVKAVVSRAVRLRECPLGELSTLYVSGRLPTYPSPKQTFTLTSHLEQNVGLGEG